MTAPTDTTSTIPTGIGNAKLAEEGVDFIIRNLSTMYTDPLYAVLREWIANAVDSVTTAHARGEIDSIRDTIHITLPDHMNPTLTVTDYGLGMDREHVFNYALNYGRSSKRDDDITAGKFGLGLKSGLAVANQFTITSVRDGKQTMGFLSLGDADGGVENFCSEAQDVDLPNQTTMSVAVGDNASTASIDIKIARVLGGYDPAMFVVTSPSNMHSLSDDELRSISRISEDRVNFGDTVYSAPDVTSNEGGWAVTAIVGGVSYPITEGLVTHEEQINDAIAEKLVAHDCKQELRFKGIVEHSVICPVDGVDIPDNRDTLIFSAKTIDTVADAYVAAILDAKIHATEYFDNVTVAQAKYDDRNTFNEDMSFIMLHTFAPQWYRNAEIITRTDTVLRDRYHDDLVIEHNNHGADIDTIRNLWISTNAQDIVVDQLNNYALMTNNTQPVPGFDINYIALHTRMHPDSIITPGKTMFITLDVSDRKTTVTRNYPNGQEYTKDVYIDDKGKEHATATECITALFKQYRVRINTWRRNNQFPTAFIGPTPEVYIWNKDDFSSVMGFDEFIEQCTAAHREHLKAQREAKKAREDNAPADQRAVARCGSLYYRDDQHEAYHYNKQIRDNITVEQLERFAENHNIAVHNLPIVTVTNGDWHKLSDMISEISFNAPAVEPVVAFLRTTKTNIRKLEEAGFTTIFDKDEFKRRCREQDAALRDEYFASLDDADRTDVATFIWIDMYCPLLEHIISDEPLEYSYFRSERTYEDVPAVVEQQFQDRNIDITDNAGYQFMLDLIDSARRGYALLAEHVPNDRHAYVDLDQNDTTTWQFAGNVPNISTHAEQPAAPDAPIEHAICGMLQARCGGGTSSAPYVGLFDREEYAHAREQAIHKDPSEYTALERVLFTEGRTQLYDLLVRIFQLDW